MSHSPEELEEKSSIILHNEQVIYLVLASSSPREAIAKVIEATGDAEIGRAARCLALLRRDHSKRFYKLIAHLVSRSTVT